MSDNFLIVISHYAARNDWHLKNLLSDISRITKNILVVINSDDQNFESEGYFQGYPMLTRPNNGMNIGGWNAAYHKYPNYKYYIFLQDECSLVRHDFLEAYEKLLNNHEVGMVGESLNFKWDRSWQDMYLSSLNYPIDVMFNSRRVSRVEYYLNLFHKWRVEPGSTGRHMRALIWGFRGETLSRLGGFPIGESKEQCIAAEIAVSKKIEQLGLLVIQASENSFPFFRHQEWRTDGTSKI